MKKIQTKKVIEAKKKTNPWAVCHTTVDKDKNPDKYERCVKDVKKKEASKNPCWDGYEQVGMKEKGGKEVPNCVPKKKKEAQSNNEWINPSGHPDIAPLREQLNQVLTGIKTIEQSIAARIDTGDMEAEKAWDALKQAQKDVANAQSWLEDAGFRLS